MNICFYCDTIFSFGGVQRVLAVIAKALSAASHEVTILTLDNPTQEDKTMYELQDSDIRFQYIRFRALRPWEYFPCKTYSYLYKKVLPQTRLTSQWYGHSSFPHSQRQLLIARLNEGNYDVVVGVHAFLSLRLASVRKQLHAPRVIGWMHTSYDAFFNTSGFYLWNLKEYFRHEIPKLDAVVVLSQTDQQRYLEELHIDATTIYNPLTLAPQEKGRVEHKRFLAVGRMSYQTKGFDILIEAFALFAKQDKEWTLEIVGEGPEEEMLRGLIAKHRLQSRITIHPFTKEIQKHYAAASVFVLSSRWEGFPLVLAEAMAHGLPIIASSIPIVKELLGKTNFCCIFDNEDSLSLSEQMLSISRQPASVVAAWGNEAIREMEHYSIDSILCQWEKLILPIGKK